MRARKQGFLVPVAVPQTERERWEAATAHIRLRYPGIVWKEPPAPVRTLAHALESVKLELPS